MKSCSLRPWSARRLPVLEFWIKGNAPFELESSLKVLRLRGDGLFGEVVSSAWSCCPCPTSAGEPDPISVLIRSCCPGVGCRIERSCRIVVKRSEERRVGKECRADWAPQAVDQE